MYYLKFVFKVNMQLVILKNNIIYYKKHQIYINNVQDMSYSSCQVQVYIVLYTFIFNIELEINEAWLENIVV